MQSKLFQNYTLIHTFIFFFKQKKMARLMFQIFIFHFANQGLKAKFVTYLAFNSCHLNNVFMRFKMER